MTKTKAVTELMPAFDQVWNLQFSNLVAFKEKHGHCVVPQRRGEDKALGPWVAKQRGLYTKHTMRDDRRERLDEIGFVWKLEKSTTMRPEYDKKWYLQYQKLIDFKRKNGHCLVTINYEQDKTLGKWVSHQRAFHTNKIIRQDRKELLDQLDFVWRLDTKFTSDGGKWKNIYKRLVEFKRTNGHCLVPFNYEPDKALGNWVSHQRASHAKKIMQKERKDLLDELKFAWTGGKKPREPHEKLVHVKKPQKWRLQYQKLVDFKRNNGHCLVPFNYEQDKSLRNWVAAQRRFHSADTIRQDRKDILNSLGFVWKVTKLATSSSITHDVRNLSSLDHFMICQGYLFFSHSFSLSLTCAFRTRILIRNC